MASAPLETQKTETNERQNMDGINVLSKRALRNAMVDLLIMFKVSENYLELVSMFMVLVQINADIR